MVSKCFSFFSLELAELISIVEDILVLSYKTCHSSLQCLVLDRAELVEQVNSVIELFLGSSKATIEEACQVLLLVVLEELVLPLAGDTLNLSDLVLDSLVRCLDSLLVGKALAFTILRVDKSRQSLHVGLLCSHHLEHLGRVRSLVSLYEGIYLVVVLLQTTGENAICEHTVKCGTLVVVCVLVVVCIVRLLICLFLEVRELLAVVLLLRVLNHCTILVRGLNLASESCQFACLDSSQDTIEVVVTCIT